MRLSTNTLFESSFPIISHLNLSTLDDALADVDVTTLSELAQPTEDEAYARVVLIDSPDLVVIAARWRAGARSELHGHGESAGLYRVILGALEEERYIPEGEELQYGVHTLESDDQSYLPSGSFHQLRAIDDSITLHAYTPRPTDAVSELSPLDRALTARARSDSQGAPRRDRSRSFDAASSSSIQELAEGYGSAWGSYEAMAVERGSYRLPPRILEDIRSSGILAAPLPRAFGGLAASLWETANAVSTIAEHAPAAALAIVMPLGNAATCRIPLSAVQPHQVRELRVSQRWIAERVNRGKILAVANSEPGASGSLANTKTVARATPRGTIQLTGRKTFATIGPDADYFLCAARRSDLEELGCSARVDGFFVHHDAPGLTLDSTWNAFGMRTTASVGIELDNSPAEAILGYAGCLETVNARHWSTLLFAAVFVGIGRAALREAVKHGGASPWARAKLAEHALAIHAAEGFLQSACLTEQWPMPTALLDRLQEVKTFATQAAVQAATASAMISGGRCYVANHPLYRLLSDSLAGPLLRPPIANAMDGLSQRLETAF